MKKILLTGFIFSILAVKAQYQVSQNFDNSLTGVYYFAGGNTTTNLNSCSGGQSYSKTFTTSSPEGGVYIFPVDLGQTNNGNSINVSFTLKKTGTMSGKLMLFIRERIGSSWGNPVYYGLDGSDANVLTPNITTGSYDCVTFTGVIPAGALNANTEYGIGVDFYKLSAGNGGLSIDDLSIVQGASNLSVSDLNKPKQLIVYPNPFHDIVRIADLKNITSITVTDISGKIVDTFAPKAELNLSYLNEGVYFININMKDNSIQHYKMLKR